MDRDYNEEEEMGNYNSGYEAGFSENQGDNLDNHKQGHAEDRTYDEERSFDAENRGFADHRGNALMLQSNAAPSLQLSALIPVLVNSLAVFLLNDLCWHIRRFFLAKWRLHVATLNWCDIFLFVTQVTQYKCVDMMAFES